MHNQEEWLDKDKTLVNEEENTCINHSYTKKDTNNYRVGKSGIKDLKKPTNQREIAVKNRELTKQLTLLRQENNHLQQACKILSENKIIENRKSIEKWRTICEMELSFILNSTLIKINRMGGYKDFLEKEMEAKKRRLEYQIDNGMEDQICEIKESDDFRQLSEVEKQEWESQMNEQLKELEKKKIAELEKLNKVLHDSEGKDFGMAELCTRLKLDYSLIFPQ
ncbi:HN1_G0023090.mRNA.1.CDS.1 [Saccharomyces cerevisiae]|nr:HN1_G0023090.mRNA.1.CDS.1 [Saccharomyces cerevisiae]CAI4799570.1 BAL_1a_G0053830.mRNA.1.CDS.1 [Saccharomyces cerevisiae]CAI7373428.1 BAL_1a_G0053830.mRNA.1.CDS.1 [Saccharomyces cerevisiae]